MNFLALLQYGLLEAQVPISITNAFQCFMHYQECLKNSNTI